MWTHKLKINGHWIIINQGPRCRTEGTRDGDNWGHWLISMKAIFESEMAIVPFYLWFPMSRSHRAMMILAFRSFPEAHSDHDDNYAKDIRRRLMTIRCWSIGRSSLVVSFIGLWNNISFALSPFRWPTTSRTDDDVIWIHPVGRCARGKWLNSLIEESWPSLGNGQHIEGGPIV